MHVCLYLPDQHARQNRYRLFFIKINTRCDLGSSVVKKEVYIYLLSKVDIPLKLKYFEQVYIFIKMQTDSVCWEILGHRFAQINTDFQNIKSERLTGIYPFEFFAKKRSRRFIFTLAHL